MENMEIEFAGDDIWMTNQSALLYTQQQPSPQSQTTWGHGSLCTIYSDRTPNPPQICSSINEGSNLPLLYSRT
jgi:hypothetical protein